MANYPSYYAPAQPGFGQAPVYQPMYGMQQPAPQMMQAAPQIPAQSVQIPSGMASSSQPGFLCRPVASLEEGKAVPTDFSGNILVMTDISHGAIYTKFLDPATGSAQFDIYKKVTDGQLESETTAQVQQPTDYAPFFTSLEEQIDRVSDRVEDLFDKLDSQKKAAIRAERKAAAE